MTPSPRKASTCGTPAPSSRTRCTAGSERCPHTGQAGAAALSHRDLTAGVREQAEGGHPDPCCPHPPQCRPAGLVVQVRLSSGGRGLDFLLSHFPGLPCPHHSEGQSCNTRAFTETLEVAIPPWEPGPGGLVGRGSVSRTRSPALALVKRCIVYSRWHIFIVMCIFRPFSNLSLVLRPHFPVSWGMSVHPCPKGAAVGR